MSYYLITDSNTHLRQWFAEEWSRELHVALRVCGHFCTWNASITGLCCACRRQDPCELCRLGS